MRTGMLQKSGVVVLSIEHVIIRIQYEVIDCGTPIHSDSEALREKESTVLCKFNITVTYNNTGYVVSQG